MKTSITIRLIIFVSIAIIASGCSERKPKYEMTRFPAHSTLLATPGFSPDGSKFAYAFDEYDTFVIKVVDTSTDKEVTFRTPGHHLTVLCWGADSKTVALSTSSGIDFESSIESPEIMTPLLEDGAFSDKYLEPASLGGEISIDEEGNLYWNDVAITSDGLFKHISSLSEYAVSPQGKDIIFTDESGGAGNYVVYWFSKK